MSYSILAASVAHAKSIHTEKAGRDFALRRALLLAIVYRRIADALPKQCAERAEALETYFKADISDRHTSVSQQLFGLFDSAIDQVLMWSGRKFFAEETQEMVARQTRLLRNLVEVERFVKILVDEGARAPKPLVHLASSCGFGRRHLSADFTAGLEKTKEFSESSSVLIWSAVAESRFIGGEPLWISRGVSVSENPKRRRRCALPAHSKRRHYRESGQGRARSE